MSVPYCFLLLSVTIFVEAVFSLEEQVVFRKKRQLEEQNPIVRTEYGPIMGYIITNNETDSFYAFSGIPYAKPPVGLLRFKDAQPPDPWGEEILDALVEGNICPQPSPTSLTDIVGDENCLFLNVYTPRLPPFSGNLLPVMFWIHGGGFAGGSGNYDSSGPDFLVSEYVIVVTINYRLGPLGFLYLNESVPGNAGMKDQVAALRWVQRNIAAFGGDPSRVTIFGESAGGASVHLLMLSPMSRGLFRAAISLSGNAINGWAVNRRLNEVSENLATAVGCPVDNNSTLQCLQTVSAYELLQVAYTLAATDVDRERIFVVPFTPTVDFPVAGVETFLTDPPIKLVTEGRYLHVPYLLGFTNNESAAIFPFIDMLNETIQQTLNNYSDAIILPELRLCGNETSNGEALQALSNFYMNGEPLNNQTLPNYLTMLTDVFFGEGTYYTLRYMAQYHYSPLYQYSFTINDELNSLLNVGGRPYLGAAHSDILGYLFRRSFLPDVPISSTAYRSRERIVRMWTNFAKYGNPTHWILDPLSSVQWKPYTKYSRNYLDIGTELIPGRDLNKLRVLFWKGFYKYFGCHKNY